MTATDATPTLCPACNGPYTIRMENGTWFCPECRHEWKPGDKPPGQLVGRQAGEPIGDPAAVLDAMDGGEPFWSFVDVVNRDAPGTEPRIDRFTYRDVRPHLASVAIDAAIAHFVNEVGAEVLSASVVMRTPDWSDELDVGDPDRDNVVILDDGAEFSPRLVDPADDWIPPAGNSEGDDAIAAMAYLESLIGVGLTLEGGQRATLLEFPDDDHATVQLADGSVVTVGFNDILRADPAVDQTVAADVELDDDTAALLGDAVLTMACLVVEAGVASIEGDGDDSRLIEPPSGWIPEDVDAIPLMEQAAAVAVAMLIQTFALPRAAIASAVDAIRPATRQAVTEGFGDDTNTRTE